MITGHEAELSNALQDFREARQRANLELLLGRLTGRPAELLSYEEVRQKLKASLPGQRKLKDVPLDAIIGSVGRYTDFTRSFLPLQASDGHRWAGVLLAVEDLKGLPPVDLYQIGDAYFVLDGNHRVSVARQAGGTVIQAYVIEIKTRVPLSPTDRPDDLIIKAEYVEFLEQTHLDQTRPAADLSLSVPGQYRLLLEDIRLHQYYRGLEWGREVSLEEAAAHWYDHIYLPQINAIRQSGILRDFPGRTETDLYIWVTQRRAELEARLGIRVRSADAARDLADVRSPRLERAAARLAQRLKAWLPSRLEAGPPPGEWRRARPPEDWQNHLFPEILVALRGDDSGWRALEQALVVARQEKAHLYGLHVPPGGAAQPEVADKFKWRCTEVGIESSLAISSGKVTDEIVARARWLDLVTVHVAYPPGPGFVARLRSNLRSLVQRCPRPVLAVTEQVTELRHALLAFDGSPKAREALYISAYLAERWGIRLTVVNVTPDPARPHIPLVEALAYLERHGLAANPVAGYGSVSQSILHAAGHYGCDWIIMGGYNLSPLMVATVGSPIDTILHESRLPVLLCR